MPPSSAPAPATILPSLPQPGNGEGTRQEAARALSNLSCNNDVSQGCQMVDEGAVPLLVAMMQVGGMDWCSGRLAGCGWIRRDDWAAACRSNQQLHAHTLPAC